MEEEEVLGFLEASLASARRALMTLRIDDPFVRQGLWLVVREGGIVVRALRTGCPLDDDMRRRIEIVLRALDATGPRIMARVAAARSPHGSPPPWRRL